MRDARLRDLFEPVFGFAQLDAQLVVAQVIEIAVRHRMTADLEARRAQLAQLRRRQVAAKPDAPGDDVKSRFEAEPRKLWRGGQRVGFAAVIKRDDDRRLLL